MATCRVKYTYSEKESSGGDEPPWSDLTFQGYDLVTTTGGSLSGGGVTIELIKRPFTSEIMPFEAKYLERTSFDAGGVGFPGNSKFQIVYTSIGESYLVGSKPDPIQLEEADSKAPPITFGGTTLPGFSYFSYAWEKITVPGIGHPSDKEAIDVAGKVIDAFQISRDTFIK